MPTYFYNDGEREVRIEADSYEQVTSQGSGFSGGQCPVRYTVQYTTIASRPANPDLITVKFVRLNGPIQGIRVEQPNSLTSRVFIAHNNTETQVDSESFSNRQIYDAVIDEVTRFDGKPDDCGSLSGSCETEFIRNGSVFFTLADCPPIREGDDCANCCAELLPIARSIRV